MYILDGTTVKAKEELAAATKLSAKLSESLAKMDNALEKSGLASGTGDDGKMTRGKNHNLASYLYNVNVLPPYEEH